LLETLGDAQTHAVHFNLFGGFKRGCSVEARHTLVSFLLPGGTLVDGGTSFFTSFSTFGLGEGLDGLGAYCWTLGTCLGGCDEEAGRTMRKGGDEKRNDVPSPGSRMKRSCPTATVSSSFARSLSIVPDWGALTDTSICRRVRTNNKKYCYYWEGGTLSVSIVATSSSAATVSPSFFDQALRVPSLMDSAIWGTLIVLAAACKLALAKGSARVRAMAKRRAESMLK